MGFAGADAEIHSAPLAKRALSGNARQMWISAHPSQASRQTQVASISPDRSQPTVLANQGDAGDRAARRAAIDAGQRGKGAS